MPALLIHLRVFDYTAWRTTFDAEEATRRAHGCTHERVFREVGNTSGVVILFDWDTPDRAWLYSQSDDFLDTTINNQMVEASGFWLLDTLRQYSG